MKRIFLILLGGVILAACSNPLNPSPAPAPQQASTLLPYYTKTPTPTRPASTPSPAQPTPFLSPTPFTHTVGAGEVFAAIAARYGLTYDELRAANLDISLSPLLVGTLLIIPGQGFTPTPQPPTPTPVPLENEAPVCLPEASGGAWCFLLMHNPAQTSLENLSARLELTNPTGEILATVTANGLLNLLPGGASLPLAVFVPQIQPPFQVRLLDWSALPVPEGDTRYLPARLEEVNILVASDGLSATVQGLIWVDGETPANLVWAALTALDANGNVIGVRRWESTTLVQPGIASRLEGQIYSAGGAIDQVVILVEARP